LVWELPPFSYPSRLKERKEDERVLLTHAFVPVELTC